MVVVVVEVEVEEVVVMLLSKHMWLNVLSGLVIDDTPVAASTPCVLTSESNSILQ